jgi:hypothetical protein
VVGDWNGSGKDGIGVFDPGTGTWYLRNEANAGPPDAGVFRYGGAGWKPVAGDWDGDGRTTIGAVDPSGTWYLRNSNTAGPPDVSPFAYGLGGWTPVAGEWNFLPALALRAAGGAAAAGPGLGGLSPSQLAGVVHGALARLEAAGVDPALVRQLSTAQFGVAELGGDSLGLASPGRGQVLLSPDAAGWGWYVDPDPRTDSAFSAAVPGGPLTAVPGGPAAGKMDLLTAVLHEMGHLAGRPDQPGTGLSDGLMTDLLATGVRRTQALDQVFSSGSLGLG